MNRYPMFSDYQRRNSKTVLWPSNDHGPTVDDRGCPTQECIDGYETRARARWQPSPTGPRGL